mgnify:CR=1 FL=1
MPLLFDADRMQHVQHVVACTVAATSEVCPDGYKDMFSVGAAANESDAVARLIGPT